MNDSVSNDEVAHRLFLAAHWDPERRAPRSSAFKDSNGVSAWLDGRLPTADPEMTLHSLPIFSTHGCVRLNVGELRSLTKGDGVPAGIDVILDPSGARGPVEQYAEAHATIQMETGAGASAIARYIREVGIPVRPPV